MKMSVPVWKFVFCLLSFIAGFPFSAISAEELRMLTFQGTDPQDHIEAFRKGIKEKYGTDLDVRVSYVKDHGDFYDALKRGEADIINCPHNVPKDPRYKLIRRKLLLPLDLKNIPNYENIISRFQGLEHVTEKGRVYGVPFTYAPYGLIYNTARFQTAPDTWNVFWQPEHAGQYAISSDMYELNIFVAALASGISKDDMGRYDAVGSPEFLEKLTYLAKNAKTFWGGVDTAETLRGLALGTGWGFSFAKLREAGETWAFADPKEGTPGGIGNFMIAHTLRKKPDLKRIAEEWINHVIGPDFQTDVLVRRLHTAPVNLAIRERLTPEEVVAFHLDDPGYFEKKLIPYGILDARTRKGFELLWQKAKK